MTWFRRPGTGVYLASHGALISVASPAQSNVIRFGAYEFEPHTGELRKEGMRIRLEGQPVAILKMLLERPGELVAREDLQRKLWPADTFVDFEHSLNAAVKRLRAALSDSADHPRYIETLSRRGYRFIAPVDTADNGSDSPTPVAIPSAEQVARNVYGRRFWPQAVV